MTGPDSRRTIDRSSRMRDAVRIAFAVFFVAAGANHFVTPEWYLTNQMPSWVPMPWLALYATGVAEICGGIGLMIPSLRLWAMRGLLMLLVAVFPANIHMFADAMSRDGWNLTTSALLLRLPLQAVFCYAIWWSTRLRSNQ